MGPNSYYVNLFTHYRPTGDPKWFDKPTDDHRPEPVVDVEGDCRLEKVSTAETATKQLGVVEAVKCSDQRLGDYISPTLFKATRAEDLIEWWKMTTPPREASQQGSGRDEL